HGLLVLGFLTLRFGHDDFGSGHGAHTLAGQPPYSLLAVVSFGLAGHGDVYRSAAAPKSSCRNALSSRIALNVGRWAAPSNCRRKFGLPPLSDWAVFSSFSAPLFSPPA